MDGPTNSSAVRPILETARKGKKRLRKVIRIWNIEKEKGNKKLEVHVRKQQNPQVSKEPTEVSFTEEHEPGKLEINARKQRKLGVIEGTTLGAITDDNEIGELEVNVKISEIRKQIRNPRKFHSLKNMN